MSALHPLSVVARQVERERLRLAVQAVDDAVWNDAIDAVTRRLESLGHVLLALEIRTMRR